MKLVAFMDSIGETQKILKLQSKTWHLLQVTSHMYLHYVYHYITKFIISQISLLNYS